MLTGTDVLRQALAISPVIVPDSRNTLWDDYLGWLLMCETPRMDGRLREETGARGFDRNDSKDNKKYWQKWRRNIDLIPVGVRTPDGIYTINATQHAVVIVVWDNLCRGLAYTQETDVLTGVHAGQVGHLCAKGGNRSMPAFQYSEKPNRTLAFEQIPKDPLFFTKWCDHVWICNHGQAVKCAWGRERIANRDCRNLANNE